MHRKRLRLRSFDYGEPGPYFLTANLQEKRPLFGSVVDGDAVLTDVGRLIESTWLSMTDRFAGLELDAYVVMPDHLHGIVLLPVDDGFRPATSLGQVMQAFKSISTVKYGRRVESMGWPRYDRRLWQRDYWEHVIRNDQDLEDKRSYIEGNPARWSDTHKAESQGSD